MYEQVDELQFVAPVSHNLVSNENHAEPVDVEDYSQMTYVNPHKAQSHVIFDLEPALMLSNKTHF